jgi:hypothetical protein
MKQGLNVIQHPSKWCKYLRQDVETLSLSNLSSVENRMEDDEFCRAALSILWRSRDLIDIPKIDIDNIERKYDCTDDDINALAEQLKSNWKDLGIGRNELMYLGLTPN